MSFINDPLVTRSDLYRDIIERGRALEQAEIKETIEAFLRIKAETEALLRDQIETARARAEIAEAKARVEMETRLRAEAEVKCQLTRVQGLARTRQGILRIILKRFLSLAEFANNLVATITDPDLLQDLLFKLALTDSVEEAEQYLLSTQAALAEQGEHSFLSQ